MRLLMSMGTALAVLLLASCVGPNRSEQQSTRERNTVSDELVPGYNGGCEKGFILYSQNQFSVGNGRYGTTIRRTLEDEGVSIGLLGNDELRSVGWIKTEHLFYPDNPAGLRGEVWYYIPNLPGGGSGWVPDAGVRAVRTEPAPNDLDEYFEPDTQAAPQPPECELFPR